MKTNKIISFLNFDSKISNKWSSIDQNNIIRDLNFNRNNCYKITNDIEWGPTFSMPLKKMIRNENNFIDISLKVKSKEDINEIILVGTLDSDLKNIYWSGCNTKDYIIDSSSSSEWIKVHLTIKLSDVKLNNNNNIIFKTFIWNKCRKNIIIDDYSVKIRNGNPYIYGLYERF